MERLLSIKTMEIRQTNVRSFVNWCELEYRGAIQARYVNSGFPKVVSDKNIRRKGVKRESFSLVELRTLLGDRQHFLKATAGVASRFWCPWIALYSGMRLEEICQLYLSDIREIEVLTRPLPSMSKVPPVFGTYRFTRGSGMRLD